MDTQRTLGLELGPTLSNQPLLPAETTSQVDLLQKLDQDFSAYQNSEHYSQFSAQRQRLIQLRQSRLILEQQCQRRAEQLQKVMAQTDDSITLQQVLSELKETEQQLRDLKSATHFHHELKGFQTICYALSRTLISSQQQKLGELEAKFTQICQTGLNAQEKRLDELTAAVATLEITLTQRLQKLESRVNVIEGWIEEAKASMTAQQKLSKAESKQITELRVFVLSLEQQRQAEQQQHQQQKALLVELQKQIAQAPDAKVVEQLQRELKAVQAQLVVEKSNPPENVPGLLQSLQQELLRQRGVLSKATVTPTLKQKMQPKLDQLDQLQKHWNQLQERFNVAWVEHTSAQEAAIQSLQQIIGESYLACDQRLKQLEADVSVLKQWAKETGQRLETMETEENDTRTQLLSLKEEFKLWTVQQEKNNAEVVELRSNISSSLPTKDNKYEPDLNPQARLLQLKEKYGSDNSPQPIREKLQHLSQKYQADQAAITAALSELSDADLQHSLQSEQQELSAKVKALEEMESRFIHLHEASIKRLTEEVQEAISSLDKRIIHVQWQVNYVKGDVYDLREQVDMSDPRYTVGLRLMDLRRKVLEDKTLTRELAYYIAPNGQKIPGSDASTPLQPWVETNFLNTNKRVLLLQGMGGSGKSTFNRHLLRRLWLDPAWENFKPGDKAPTAFVPIFVPLGSSKVDPRRLFDYLRDLPELMEDFTDNEINVLKSAYRLLWIADGYDEMPGNIKVNIYELNSLDQYAGRMKLLISRRSDPPLTVLEEKTHLMPSNETVLDSHYLSYYVAPFNDTQINDYIAQYLKKKREPSQQFVDDEDPGSEGLMLWEDALTYQKHFALIPSIEKLIRTPFLLMIAVETLPTIIAEVEREQSRLSQKSQQKSGQMGKIELTRKKLLAGFVESWFSRQAAKTGQSRDFLENPDDLLGGEFVEELMNTGPGTEDIQVSLLKKGYLLFCQELAKHLQREQRVSVQYPPLEEKRLGKFGGGGLSSTPVNSTGSSQTTSTQWIRELFDPQDRDMSRCRRGSPLRTSISGQGRREYGFLHPLLIDYFVSTILADEPQPGLITSVVSSTFPISQLFGLSKPSADSKHSLTPVSSAHRSPGLLPPPPPIPRGQNPGMLHPLTAHLSQTLVGGRGKGNSAPTTGRGISTTSLNNTSGKK